MPETLSQVAHAWLCRMQVCWAGLESGSELPPKPLILLSQHVSLSLKMSNPALKISTLNIFLGYWWIWWLGFKIASTFRSCFTGLWLCQSKENCSVNCSSGLLYPAAFVCISQSVRWCVLVLWHWELFPSQPQGWHVLSSNALGPAFGSPAARQDLLWLK